ncbi:META domain-containing protein [Agromyces archimandritae]|uniref:META domain-containing protein n=1 Tax=Agromyces archimandritae TaxID=2781962 RepID=A0A975FJ60_9MICO|nr:META domain-containing protein [Agromyces archimandritae]QTX03465.1 META domain-containing protein [Agromyces archimandritae]
MAIRGWMPVALAAVAALALAGCTSGGSDDAPPPSAPPATTPAASAPATTPAPPTDAAPIPAPWDAYVGTWGDPEGVHLMIGGDGRFSGYDGCNRMGGRWDPEDDGGIEFDDVFMTQRACEGVDTPLSRLEEGRLDGETLTVLGDEDVFLLTLPRTD